MPAPQVSSADKAVILAMAKEILLSMLSRSGVREWDDQAARQRMAAAAYEMAEKLFTLNRS
jgi:hypothetical protein